ncbi:hypothetical protein O3P69_018422 [Scylla paramamosain]|uniref:Hexosyltransferase n=2 Tax=Scylla paramamosain TaxID=85552 RepID=A0AAW0T251_SCYPA
MNWKLFSGWGWAVAGRCLASGVVVVVVLAIHRHHAPTKAFRIKYRPLRPTTRQPFLPDLPSQTRPGQPADIPQRFLLEEDTACHRMGEDVEVVAYVHSAITRVEQRQETRRTWANSTALKMVVVFMVGRPRNRMEQVLIQKESSFHHDIVQGDYADHYHLLSYKALSSLRWITKNCAHVPWTLHADDDVLVDTFFLRQFIQGQERSQDRDKLHCKELVGEKVHRKGKWGVLPSELAATHYPPYCQGFLWLLPTAQVPKLLQASAYVNFLWVDDAYITGFLAIKANISIHDIKDLMATTILASVDVGTKLAWVHLLFKRRSVEWQRILNHYRVPGSPQPQFGRGQLPRVNDSLVL